jgi:hypothetical protein
MVDRLKSDKTNPATPSWHFAHTYATRNTAGREHLVWTLAAFLYEKIGSRSGWTLVFSHGNVYHTILDLINFPSHLHLAPSVFDSLIIAIHLDDST